MFGRRSETVTPSTPAAGGQPDGPGKGRPTPKRATAEAARKQPLVPSSRTSGGKGKGKGRGRGTGKEARLAARAERIRARELMVSGDERYLPARDKGPARRYVRDVIDARWNIGEILLPTMLVVVLLSWFGSFLKVQSLTTLLFSLVYAMVLVSLVDSWLMARRMKKGITARFGADAYIRGTTLYAIMRSFQIRRTRIPRPALKRGQPPR